MDFHEVIPKTQPADWVSSLTSLHKPDCTHCICLDPHDLNMETIRENYQTPTLDEISHELNGATIFSKFHAKDSLWSIHLN